ncbi:hypothetical protein J6590_090093 [Homalodisca vitripennis]|nr:hypothetical protein J6590_090093 [Homalodisca vitripennis]
MTRYKEVLNFVKSRREDGVCLHYSAQRNILASEGGGCTFGGESETEPNVAESIRVLPRALVLLKFKTILINNRIQPKGGIKPIDTCPNKWSSACCPHEIALTEMNNRLNTRVVNSLPSEMTTNSDCADTQCSTPRIYSWFPLTRRIPPVPSHEIALRGRDHCKCTQCAVLCGKHRTLRRGSLLLRLYFQKQANTIWNNRD